MFDITIARTDKSAYIGVDIGGTSTRVGLFQSLDSPDFTLIARLPTEQSYEQQLHNIISTVKSSGLEDYAGIGVSVAGRIAKDGQGVIVAPNLPEYVGKPLAQDLSYYFQCPVRLAHDAVCGLLAEKKFGHMRNFDRCAYLTVSTGTGAAIQLGKAQISLTSSIEIGHQILDGNTLRCLCGQVGCLETFTGGRQIELLYGHSPAHITDSAFWETFSDKLAIGLVNLAQLTRIDAIAISGAIALNNPFLLPLLQHKVNGLLRGATLELSLARLRENAPLVGAAVLLEVPESTILH
jgi:glucokinase